MNFNEIVFRPYQTDSFHAIKGAYHKGIKEQLVVQATGLGKRIQAIKMSTLKKFPRNLFLAHSEELISQAYADMCKAHSWTDVGIIKYPKFELDKKIIVASPQSLYNHLNKIPKNLFDLIQIDEAHRYMAPTWLDVVRHFEYDLRIGWTATPHRLDGLSLGNLFQDIVFEYNIDQGIRDKYLCELDAIQIKTQIELQGIKKTGGDFNQGQLEERVDTPARNTLIANKYKEYAHGRQAIAFCVSIVHAHRLATSFQMLGYRAEALSSETSHEERLRIISEFKAGRIDILCNVMILTEGFDYSNVGCVIQARPTQSLTVFMQQIGRGTRLKTPDYVEKFGQNCLILDIIDITGKHNVINTWELDRTKKAKDKTFVSEEKREKLLNAERERDVRIEVSSKEDKRVNLIKLPKVTVSGSPKMLEPATEAQINYMIKLGVYIEGVEYTKALASEAISNSPASMWQVRWLKEQNYDVSEGVSVGQYQKAKNYYDWINRSKVDPELLK
jgi:superfamily II DNA or RNA helicase